MLFPFWNYRSPYRFQFGIPAVPTYSFLFGSFFNSYRMKPRRLVQYGDTHACENVRQNTLMAVTVAASCHVIALAVSM